MKAMRIHAYGGPETLVYEEADCPTSGSGQVLLRVHAAGVNPMDWKIREGWFKDIFDYPLPLILGTDVAGVVESVGAGVTTLKPGQAVYGVVDMTLSGSYAEYAIARTETIAPKPETIDYQQSAAIPIASMTAWQGLFEVGGLSAGQSVLIHAAAGGVGSFAVQFAKLYGLEVIGTASTQNLTYVYELGADEVIDYQTTDFEQRVYGVDMVFDPLGGETQVRSLKVLKPGSILVSTATPPDPRLVAQAGVRAVMMMVQPQATLLTKIAALIDQGKVKLPKYQVFSLYEARQAHELSQQGHVRGKLVLQVH
ncbi:MAG: NADP-dependent oxidoreductase [Leptolyngbyaceae cyanobacterium bins.302]|nr:NADP-dependent oxidoreductase [Leptolyngbyaceae cyanobacterium bins.302]